MKEKILICTIVMLSVFMFLVSSAPAAEPLEKKKLTTIVVLGPSGETVKIAVPEEYVLCPCFTYEEVELILAQEGSTCSQYVGTALDDQGSALADTCTAVVCSVETQSGDPPVISAIEGPADSAECMLTIGNQTQYEPTNLCLYYEGNVTGPSQVPPQSVEIDENGADVCVRILQNFLW